MNPSTEQLLNHLTIFKSIVTPFQQQEDAVDKGAEWSGGGEWGVREGGAGTQEQVRFVGLLLLV